MHHLGFIKQIVQNIRSVDTAGALFRKLGYPVIPPLPEDISRLPEGARNPIASVHRLVDLGDGSPLRIFHVELKPPSVRRTDIRRFLEAFYRHYPQGENLFVFVPPSYDEIVFVSPRRLPDPRDPTKVRLWLRILPVRRESPYRTDLEVLRRIRTDGELDPQKLWQRHDEAFSVQRVTEQFFRDYAEIFGRIRGHLHTTHPENGPEWARDYTHQLLNRIMFLYFIARKGWLLGPKGDPDRDFMRHFWEAYREAGTQNTFHAQWLPVLFFEAFNNRWQNRADDRQQFPEWLIRALDQAPFLNGGLYTKQQGLDDRLQHPLPDAFFELLFDRWTDGTFPGLFERYNFTVVESGRFDEEVAVDPEMLGMVYERLVNITFEAGDEDLRGQAGIFYTPRTEIDLMSRLSLVDWMANHLGATHKDLLYRWVFAFSEDEKQAADEEVTRQGLWEDLDALVRRVRVVDPACGSGAFLVGMLLVLDDLQRRCDMSLGRDRTAYERRKHILQDQIYGVDVMEWAVRVAELRLWLQLVVETELEPAELHFRPLLPNLNFKLRPGDSLLQTVGDLDLSPFRGSNFVLPRHLKGKLTRLKGKKRRFFQGEEPGLAEALLKKEEQDLFREILEHKRHKIDQQIQTKRKQLAQIGAQGSLLETSPSAAEQKHRAALEEEIRHLEQERQRLEEALSTLRLDQPPPFVWDLAFMEIFEDENPGFDIVIGNPPYVRQEKIRDYLNRFNRSEYLRRLNDGLRAIYPGFMGRSRRISGRADYYVYFYLHALSLLAERGSFCFITSNSWLDVDFGKDLQEFFLRYGWLKMVIDNRARRSFAQADVNTVIVLAGPPERKRPLTEEDMKARVVHFVAFRVPFEKALSPMVFSEIEDDGLYEPMAHFRVLRRPEYRAVRLDAWTLWQEGLRGDEKGQLLDTRKYEGNKWGGKYLRAPDIYFTILEKAQRYRVFLDGKTPKIVEDITDMAEDGMKFVHIRDRIVNNPGFRTLEEVRRAGYRIVKERDGDRYFLVKPDELQPLLVRLGDIAEVRRGFTTGANEFFYLEPVGMTVKEVAELRKKNPMAPVRVRNRAGWEGEIEAGWLRPVIKSPREIHNLRVRLEDLRYLVLMPPEDVRKAIDKGRKPPLSRYPKAADYIRWGEKQDYPNRPTCRSRRWWWDLGEQDPPPVVLNKGINDRHFVTRNSQAFCDQQVYEMLIPPHYSEVVASCLNWTGTAVFWEQYGRRNFGEGVLWIAVYEASKVLTVTPLYIQKQTEHLLSAFNRLAGRPIRSIFEELGFELCRRRRCRHPEHPYEQVKPEALTLEQVRQASPDRFELDRVIFDVLGLTDEERLEVYRAVAELVKDRLVKARSV